jgi:hypothetical protein
MLDIDEVLKLTNCNEIEKEIIERYKLIDQLMGLLYAEMLYNEIEKLKTLITKVLKDG